jgi:hypothetical protein
MAIEDANLEQYGPWLGGLFEVGGSVGFSTFLQKNNSFCSLPNMSFADNHQPAVQRLANFLGGKVYVKGKRWEWTVQGKRGRVPLIAEMMQNYSPRRREVLLGIHNWVQAEADERVQIARDLKGYNGVKNISSDEYDDLIKIPKFVAGLFDSRAITHFYGYSRKKYPERIDHTEFTLISSSTKLLLDKLQQEYGGTVFTKIDPKSVSHQGDKVRNNGSFGWQLGNNDLINLLPTIQSHLILVTVNGHRISRD